jgi:23S rRNA (uracil1939-C5)-methyltransferase
LSAVEEITAKASRIVDLFAGAGTFTLPLATCAEVHAVEGEAEMIAALDRGWREGKGLKRVTSEARDLFRRPLEPDELRKFDAAVIDPPRAGAEAQIATLAASEIKVIAMVSCNPVTFARDAVTLQKAGFTLDWVQVVDQFRWSAHVEVVGSFTRK